MNHSTAKGSSFFLSLRTFPLSLVGAKGYEWSTLSIIQTSKKDKWNKCINRVWKKRGPTKLLSLSYHVK